VELADRHRLLPAAWCAALDRGLMRPLPAEARAAVERRLTTGTTQPAFAMQAAYEANRTLLERQLAQWSEVEERFRTAGVEAVPLKGLHGILAGWWPDAAARPMDDLDVLVAPEHAQAADRVLAELGYLRAPENDWADHHLPQRWSDGVCIEVHTALSTSRSANVLPAADVLRAGRLTTTHAVVHLIEHAQLQHEGHRLAYLHLGRMYELAVVAGGPHAEEIDWDEVRARFDRAGVRPALERYLVMARALLGATVPARAPQPGDVLYAARCGLDLEHTLLGRLQFYAVKAPARLSADRMRRLYGHGNVWRHRARHVRRLARS
jgi:hypothetical protein